MMNTHRAAPHSRAIWFDSMAVLLLLLALYISSASGHLYSPDEEAMYYVTSGIASGHGVALPQGDVVPMLGRRGVDRDAFSPYGLLPSALALPLYGMGALAARGLPTADHDYLTRFGVSLLNAPVSALTCALLYGFTRQLGFGRRAGWLAALGYGVCTFAWPYARTFFSEPLAGLLLLAAVERAHAFRAKGRWGALAWCGVACGLLLATRLAEAIALPVIAAYLFWPGAPPRRPIIIHAAVWLLGLLPGLAIIAGYNLVRFGSVLASGYGDESSAFTTPLLVGMFGLLFSPGKSLLLYAPPAVLALPGGMRLWRRTSALALLLGTLALAHVLLYALWHAWDGGGVWGPRLLLPVVPLLLVLAAPVLAAGGWWRVPVGVLLGLGAINALAGVLVNFAVYVNSPVSATTRTYQLDASPLLVHWQILASRAADWFGPEQCALADGFFPSEAQNALLPRYSGAQATITCRAKEPVLLHLGINDDRPDGVAASQLTLLVGGTAAPLPTGRSRQVALLLPPVGSVTLANSTWNPAHAGRGVRDAAVGTLVFRADAVDTAGTRLRLADAAIEPPPASPRLRWGWYFVPYNHHLVDLWPWYLARSGLPPAVQMRVALVVAGAGLLLLAGDAWAAWRGRRATASTDLTK